MTLRLAVDVEALAVDWLKDHASIAALVGTRVATALPAAPTWPFLTVSLVAGAEKVADHLDEQYLDLFAWADTKESAKLLIRTARAVMIEARRGAHDRGVVTDVRTVSTPRWLPDGLDAPVRPRYVCTMALTVHPHRLALDGS